MLRLRRINEPKTHAQECLRAESITEGAHAFPRQSNVSRLGAAVDNACRVPLARGPCTRRSGPYAGMYNVQQPIGHVAYRPRNRGTAGHVIVIAVIVTIIVAAASVFAAVVIVIVDAVAHRPHRRRRRGGRGARRRHGRGRRRRRTAARRARRRLPAFDLRATQRQPFRRPRRDEHPRSRTDATLVRDDAPERRHPQLRPAAAAQLALRPGHGATAAPLLRGLRARLHRRSRGDDAVGAALRGDGIHRPHACPARARTQRGTLCDDGRARTQGPQAVGQPHHLA